MTSVGTSVILAANHLHVQFGGNTVDKCSPRETQLTDEKCIWGVSTLLASQLVTEAVASKHQLADAEHGM
jgi:hypothetical protein